MQQYPLNNFLDVIIEQFNDQIKTPSFKVILDRYDFKETFYMEANVSTDGSYIILEDVKLTRIVRSIDGAYHKNYKYAPIDIIKFNLNSRTYRDVSFKCESCPLVVNLSTIDYLIGEYGTI